MDKKLGRDHARVLQLRPVHPRRHGVPQTMSEEVWKQVPRFAGYEVSTLGRVRSSKPQRNNGPTPKSPRLLVIDPNGDGYPSVTLYAGSKATRRDVTVSKLVLEVFDPDGFKPGLMALHKNGNKADNRLENLYWGTAQNNSDDCLTHGNRVCGEQVNTCVLTEEKVRYVLRQKGRTTAGKLAAEVGCSVHNIRAIWGRKTWKHIQG